MKIVLFGKGGQLGFELQRTLSIWGEVVALGREGCDFMRPDSLGEVIRAVMPDVIVNAAAYTAVDGAEHDSAQAMAVNGIAPRILAHEAKAVGALLIHYSSDYVFDGNKPSAYVEEDVPAPQNVYGRSKLAGEDAVREVADRYIILRTSWVYGVHGNNFLKTVLRLIQQHSELRIVADQVGIPTSAALIADVTAAILGRYVPCHAQAGQAADFPYGTYHLAAVGATTWHEYAQLVARHALQAGLSPCAAPEAIRAISTADYPLPARRPPNSVLDTTKLQRTFGLALPPWQQGVVQATARLVGGGALPD